MMKSIIISIGVLLALISFASADVSQLASEAPIQRVHILNPGEREYLSPNLIGVQNIAVTNIPLTLNFINIIDAYREVVDGVRYEIVLNAVNTTDNNTEIVCRIVVLEKPWLTTLWGDKVRLLQESNCTSEEIDDHLRDRKSVEEKYETNSIFTGSRNELTADDMSRLESQILTSSNPQLTRQRTTTSTTEDSIIIVDDGPQPQVTESAQAAVEPAISSQNNEPENNVDSRDDNASPIVVEESDVAPLPEVSSTTTEQIPELSDAEKKWLDDFLSIGAYNFETSLQNKKAAPQGVTTEEQSGDQEADKEPQIGLAGGVKPLTAAELEEEKLQFTQSLAKLATGDGPSYTIDKIYSGSKQVVAGSLVKLDVDLVNVQTGEKSRCTLSLWSQPWLEKDGYELNIEWKDKPKTIYRHSRSIEEKDIILGGFKQLTAAELEEEKLPFIQSLAKLATGDGPSYTIDKIYSGSMQFVAGTLVKLDVDLVNVQSGEKSRCTLSLWSQPWLKEDGYELSIEWTDKPKTVFRHSRSIEEVKPKTKRALGGKKKLTDAELKEQEQVFSTSLAKVAAGANAPNYRLLKLVSGTKQVVSGSLVEVKAELEDASSGEKVICDLALWSQPWLQENGYEMTIKCAEKPKSVHRYSKIQKGAPRPLNADELNEEKEKIATSLTKISSGAVPSYSISQVFNGTKQIVAGTLVKIFAELIDGSTGAKENCTVSQWSRPWVSVDGYKITLECNEKPMIEVRHSRSVEHAQKKTHKKNHRTLDKAEHLFRKFQNKFNKKYHTTMEHQMRLRIFKHNLKLIQDLNKNEMGSAKYGITEFADMTTTEYRERTGLLERTETNAVRTQAQIPDVELPKEFDWREKGVISQVKNQGNCGSCWAFSVTGNIEGIHAVKTGKLEEYSEQELLDCDTIDSACQGGLPDSAYEAIQKIGGLELESEYPYEAKKGKCHFNSTLSRVKISGAVDLPKNETAMAQWLIANGPISIGINANAMQFYRGGVSHPWKVLCSKGNLDHGVLIVGFGVSDYPMFKKTLPYWIVKNSWGPKWGEQGYYRVYRGDNTCGVSEMATSAILAS